MNQLLIAILISTSLAGVIQGGFVSLSNNDKNQVIDELPAAEVSKVVKDDLADYIYIEKPAEITSSTSVQVALKDEPSSCKTVHTDLTDKPISDQSSANEEAKTTDKVEKVDLKAKERKETISNKEKAEMAQGYDKDKEKPAVEAMDKAKDTTVNSAEKDEDTKLVVNNTAPAVEVEEEKNTSTENTVQDGKTITVKATAYTADCEGGTGVTYTGIDLRANPEQKVIAVDPSVIPLGTKVYVEGYGHAIAADIGGAIKGNKIDVFIPTQAEAEDWGIKTVDVQILED
jgi:3D (Asp-Asp-Asp) domain-containing protein